MDCPTNYIYETTRCVCNFITCMILTARCTHRKCIRSILQHFTLNLEVGHLCGFFYLQFLFCTILKLSPAARCADHVSHQFCSKKQPIIIFAICVFILVFYILYFICNLYFLLVLQQKLKLHLFCNHYFCITSILQQLIMTCVATVLGDSFRSRFQMSEKYSIDLYYPLTTTHGLNYI